MAEWLKAHAWKACLQQCNVGSNPSSSIFKLYIKITFQYLLFEKNLSSNSLDSSFMMFP